ncbi:hypothetical protein RF55_7940 [Lasius niger]|uniref:Uncharacterized protein n=1 Tax=Lasius niger TaxID=67767 RepID=A0A0J7KP39_LASNI|nr:hypothetical protein RF55_7940 [Lasius niger]
MEDNLIEDLLLPQGIRTPSGGRTDFTVAEIGASLSSVGPALSLTTGKEHQITTVISKTVPDTRDPSELTFVDCASTIEEELQLRPDAPGLEPEPTATSTPGYITGIKRNAKKASPNAPSEDSGAKLSGVRSPWVVLRKLKTRPRKRKPKEGSPDIEEDQEEIFSTPASSGSEINLEVRDKTEEIKKSRKILLSSDAPLSGESSDVEYTGTKYLKPASTRSLRPRGKKPQTAPVDFSEKIMDISPARKASNSDRSCKSGGSKGSKTNKTSKKSNAPTIESSSDEEDEGEDFAPEILRIMSATKLEAKGLNGLRKMEAWRSGSKSFSGEISGKMKRKLAVLIDVVNTLIFNVEASGDSDTSELKYKNLLVELEKMKFEDIRKNRSWTK